MPNRFMRATGRLSAVTGGSRERAVILVLLGLCAVIVQIGVVIIARRFLDFHQEQRPLSAIGQMVRVTGVIFTELTFLSTLLHPRC